MTKNAYNKIAERLKEALAIARGQTAPVRLYEPEKVGVRTKKSEFAQTV